MHHIAADSIVSHRFIYCLLDGYWSIVLFHMGSSFLKMGIHSPFFNDRGHSAISIHELNSEVSGIDNSFAPILNALGGIPSRRTRTLFYQSKHDNVAGTSDFVKLWNWKLSCPVQLCLMLITPSWVAKELSWMPFVSPMLSASVTKTKVVAQVICYLCFDTSKFKVISLVLSFLLEFRKGINVLYNSPGLLFNLFDCCLQYSFIALLLSLVPCLPVFSISLHWIFFGRSPFDPYCFLPFKGNIKHTCRLDSHLLYWHMFINNSG